jgi:hypothetical protein
MEKLKLVSSMRLLFEGWRTYISEVHRIPSFQLYVDLDGVLVDFRRGAVDTINADLQTPERVPEGLRKKYNKMVRALKDTGRSPQREGSWKVTAEDFDKKSENRINAVRNYMYPRFQDDLQFWSELNWIEPDGHTLWEAVKDMNPPPIILTSPMHGQGSHKGKEIWVQNNLGINNNRVIVERDKWKYATGKNGEQNILIDDTPEKIKDWETPPSETEERLGGIGILHTSVADTLKKLSAFRENNDVSEMPLG